MKKERLVALRNIYYDGDRVEGEEFDVLPEHVFPLVRTGAAKHADQKTDKAGTYDRRDLRAEK